MAGSSFANSVPAGAKGENPSTAGVLLRGKHGWNNFPLGLAARRLESCANCKTVAGGSLQVAFIQTTLLW
jgi:hypothetical protein